MMYSRVYIYFARPTVLDESAFIRPDSGRRFWQRFTGGGDLVVGVPESWHVGGLKVMESGIPYGNLLLVKNSCGKDFYRPKQSSREPAVSHQTQCAEEGVRWKESL